MGLTIEDHYGQPMDIEWAKDGRTGDLFIVQARPETVHVHQKKNRLERYVLDPQASALKNPRDACSRPGRRSGPRSALGRVRLYRSTRRKSRRPPHVGLDNVGVEHSAPAADGASGRDLDQALQLLSGEQRRVVLLVGLEGLSYAETAEILEIPVGTVMSRLARGRDRLRSLMDYDGDKNGRAQLRRVK